MTDKVPVYILAGGKSRRFQRDDRGGGRVDKARFEIEGNPLIRHVAEAARPVAASITVVAAEADAYRDLGFRTLPDLQAGLGPIGGLDAALRDTRAGWVLVLACDLHGMRTPWLRTLLDARSAEGQAVLFREGDRLEPLIALYHTAAHAEVERAIRAGQYAMHLLVGQLEGIVLPAPADWGTLRNLNRPGDPSEA